MSKSDPEFVLFVRLSMVGRTKSERGNAFDRRSQVVGEASRKGGGAMQTQREKIGCSYSVQTAHTW